jgi:hypothetical protein
MSAIVISKVAPIVAVADMNGNATASANAATPDPKEVVVMSGSVGNGWLKLDLGSSQLIDGFFLGFSSGITADVYVGNSSGSQGAYLGNCPLAASDVSNRHLRRPYKRSAAIRARLGIRAGACRYVQRDGAKVRRLRCGSRRAEGEFPIHMLGIDGRRSRQLVAHRRRSRNRIARCRRRRSRRNRRAQRTLKLWPFQSARGIRKAVSRSKRLELYA